MAVILNWVYLMFFLASRDYSNVSSSTTSFSSQRRAFVPPWPKLNVRIRSIVCRLLWNAVFTVTKLLDMFDNKMLKVQSAREMLFLRLKCVCVCVCVCVFARARARVCVCVRARRAPKQTSKVHFELRARPNDQIHTQYVKTDGLESIPIHIGEYGEFIS